MEIAEIIPNEPLDFELMILHDVNNPLYGPHGAAHVFAKQKGASDLEVEQLDDGLHHVAKLIKSQFKLDIADLQGGGAAGGIAAGLKAFVPNTQLVSGFDYIANICKLEEAVRRNDLIITGEGSLDETSLNGKLIQKLAGLCSLHAKKLIVVAGQSSLDEEALAAAGIQKVYTILDKASSIKDAIANAKAYLADLNIEI